MMQRFVGLLGTVYMCYDVSEPTKDLLSVTWSSAPQPSYRKLTYVISAVTYILPSYGARRLGVGTHVHASIGIEMSVFLDSD